MILEVEWLSILLKLKFVYAQCTCGSPTFTNVDSWVDTNQVRMDITTL
jgi:hypothetical protein